MTAGGQPGGGLVPELMTYDQLADVLDDLAGRVRSGDSFEGSLAYTVPRDLDSPADVVLVHGAFRVGNNAGQGGMRMFGSVPGAVDCPAMPGPLWLERLHVRLDLAEWPSPAAAVALLEMAALLVGSAPRAANVVGVRWSVFAESGVGVVEVLTHLRWLRKAGWLQAVGDDGVVMYRLVQPA